MKFRARRVPGSDRLVCSVKRLASILLLTLCAVAFAQERYNFLAVDGSIVDDAGPYYFIAHGDSVNAFARAQPFADALGLALRFDDATKSLVFSGAGRQARLATTADIAYGLVKRSDAFTVDGSPFSRPVPMGILVDGVSYVAVAPVVEAFFGAGATGWHAEARVITIERPAPDPESSLAEIAPPRVGTHDDFTRVAFDLPADLRHEVSIDGDSIVITVPGAAFDTWDLQVGDDRVRRVYTQTLAADGMAALVIETYGRLATDGSGFRSTVTDGGVFYVDVAAGLREPVVASGSAGTASAPRPPAVAERAGAVSEPLIGVPAEPLRKVVVIDAGHGGRDSGTVSSWARENTVALAVALELRNVLEAEGVDVILTRDDDTFLTLQDRSRFATTERNAFVSIHANAAPSRSAQGIETWVFGRPLDSSQIDQAIRENGGGDVGQALTDEAAEQANIAGEIVRQNQLTYSLNLAEAVQSRLVDVTGARDRGVRQNLFYVIRTARIPAILVEVGFISNPDEGPKLATERYQRTLARALADGILEFLESGGAIASR